MAHAVLPPAVGKSTMVVSGHDPLSMAKHDFISTLRRLTSWGRYSAIECRFSTLM